MKRRRDKPGAVVIPNRNASQRLVSFRTFRSLWSFRTLRFLVAIRTFRPLNPLGPVRPFHLHHPGVVSPIAAMVAGHVICPVESPEFTTRI